MTSEPRRALLEAAAQLVEHRAARDLPDIGRARGGRVGDGARTVDAPRDTHNRRAAGRASTWTDHPDSTAAIIG